MSRKTKLTIFGLSTVTLGLAALSFSLNACKMIPSSEGIDGNRFQTDNSPTFESDDDSQGDSEESTLSLTSTDCKNATNLSKITLSPSGELFINDPAVLADVRAKAGGKWSFGYAMREILELPAPGSNLTLLAAEDAKIKTFIKKLAGQEKINTFLTQARTTTETNLNTSWGKVTGSDKKLYFSFDKAPFKLLAIVNRVDVVKKGRTAVTAGEGRLIFGFTGPQTMTLNFEYDLPIGTASAEKLTLLGWADKWHALKTFLVDTNATKAGVQPASAFPSVLKFRDKAGYLSALEKITERFVNRKARFRSGTITQSALAQIRTNELFRVWEMREIIRTYGTNAATNFALTTVKNNPDRSFANGEKGFAAWLGANVTCKVATDRTSCSYNTPDGLLPNSITTAGKAVPLLAASEPVNFTWFPSSTQVKQRFLALDSCGGCHQSETGTGFLHVDSATSDVSPYLINEVKVVRTSNLKNLICLNAGAVSALNLTGKEGSESEEKDQTDGRIDYTYRVH